jgi:hypothetical protein
MELHSEALERLKAVFENPLAQKALVKLYAQSQTECTRNGKCGMEIGMSREKDQVAVLKAFLGEAVRLDIDNSLPEDFLLFTEKVSAKHSSSAVGTAIKAKWTSADKSVEADIRAMVEAEDSYYPHLLLTYIEVEKKKITFVAIPAEHNKTTIKTLGPAAFKVPKGNSRGVEYSTAAMRMLMERAAFRVVLTDADVKGGEDPIDRRIELLRSAGLCP